MRTLNELREFLLDTITEIKSGKCDIQKANAICSTANSVISLTRLQMDYNENAENELKFISEEGNIKMSLKEIEERKKLPVVFGK